MKGGYCSCLGRGDGMVVWIVVVVLKKGKKCIDFGRLWRFFVEFDEWNERIRVSKDNLMSLSFLFIFVIS